MTPEQLLQECENLTHNGRMRRMFEIGALASHDTNIRDIIDAFAQGDVYQRLLALQSCYGSHDTALALRGLADPSRRVRGLALKIIALICSDAELQMALAMLPLDSQDTLLRLLYRRRRRVPTDMYLETLAARQDEALRKLLPLGSQVVVERHLGQVIERFELAHWQRLARRHAPLAFAQLQARADVAQASHLLDQRLVVQVNAALPALTSEAPDLALDLVRVMLAVVPLASLDAQVVVRRRPNEIADLVLQAEAQAHIRFDAVARYLTSERLLALYTRYPHTISAHIFRKLSPEQRLAIYTACERGWRSSEGVLDYQIVTALPTAQLRMQEGRRHLALPALITRPTQQIHYAAFLPWDEARATLDDTLRSPDADLRGATLNALITAVRYQRDRLADALQLVVKRKNEQDPVRCEMLSALASLPYVIWRTEHLDDLAQIIRDALNATDLSTRSAQAVEKIVVHLLPFHPEWCASQLATLYLERGMVSYHRLEHYLSDADMRHLVPILLPVLRAWRARENNISLARLAHNLGKRLRVFDEFIDILATVVLNTPNNFIVNTILEVLADHRRERLAALIPTLLTQDQSAIVIRAVYTYLHRYRQDLITPFLGQQAYKGWFANGRTRFVLPIKDGFYRWTPTQQELFALTLLEVVNDQQRQTPALMNAIHQLAAMPALNSAYIIQFANDERQPVRDTALRVLGRLDAGQGIPTLLEALNDERARIAIYALRYALLGMPQAEALRILRAVPLTTITVAKEVVRLIGDLSSEEAYHELLELDTRELHRDVRIALLRAFWPYVERAETWEIFTRAAQSSDAALPRSLANIPADGMTTNAQKQLVVLLARLLGHAEPRVRLDVLSRCITYPVTDYEHVLLAPLTRLMNSLLPDECALAAKAVFATYMGNDALLVGEALRGMLDNRRALQTAVESLLFVLPTNRARLLPTTRIVLAALAEDRLTISLRIGLILTGLPWEDVAQELIKLAGELHPDALSKTEQMIREAVNRPDADLLSLEMALMSSDDERLRRLALAALIAQAHQPDGWSDERIARLQVYQQDPSLLVAEAAQFTFVS